MTQSAIPAKAIDKVKAEFRRAGVTVTGWCAAHGFERSVVVDLLRGRSQGLRGESHRAAVALGLKQGTVIDPRKFKVPPPAVAAAPRPRQARRQVGA